MLLAIDVCGERLQFAEGSAKTGTVEIIKAGSEKLSDSVVDDGEIKNLPPIVMAINRALQAKSYKAVNAAVTFSSSRIFSRRLSLPNAKPKVLTKMVRSEMQQLVSDLGDAAVEYSVRGDNDTPKSKMLDIWAFAIPGEFIKGYYSIFDNIRLKPFALDIHANSVEKLLAGASINGENIEKTAALFCDIAENSVEIHLFSGGHRVFSRVSRLLRGEADYSLPGMGMPGGEIQALPSEVREDARSVTISDRYLSRLADELEKMVQFQLRRDSSNPVSRVYIYGGRESLLTVPERLSPLLHIQTQVVENVSKIHCDEKLAQAEILNCAGALIRL